MQRVSEALVIGARLEVGIGDDHLEWLPSRVEDSLADGRLVLAWPTDRDRRPARFEPGQSIELMTVAREDALYAATASVVELTPGEVPLVTLAVSGAWQRRQRRNAVRASIAVRPRVADVLYGPARKSVRLGVTNVSSSGVQVRSQDELRRGELLELAFELDGEIEVRARVTRVQRLERVWDAGCEFESLPERLADRIVQFIFARQRAALRLRRGAS
jgi:c-di-GMP-binding flagellar brake protein YcgR